MRLFGSVRWVAVVFALIVAGCGTLSVGKRDSQFQIQMLAFENAIRWGEFRAADRFRKREAGASDTDFARFEGIRVSSYEVLSTAPGRDENQVIRTVRIGYYRESNPGVRTLIQQQSWEYDPEREVWQLAGPLPEFR